MYNSGKNIKRHISVIKRVPAALVINYLRLYVNIHARAHTHARAHSTKYANT
jgi:hypothetical protein